MPNLTKYTVWTDEIHELQMVQPLKLKPRKENPVNATRDATMSIVPTSLKTYFVKLYRFDKS